MKAKITNIQTFETFVLYEGGLCSDTSRITYIIQFMCNMSYYFIDSLNVLDGSRLSLYPILDIIYEDRDRHTSKQTDRRKARVILIQEFHTSGEGERGRRERELERERDR